MDQRLLYVSASHSGANWLDRPALAGMPIEVAGLPPAALTNAAAIEGAAAVVVDGRSLGARAIDVVRRVRWLGFAGTLFLAHDSGSELDRAIARESGVDEVLSASVPLAEIATRCARLVADRCARADSPASPDPNDHRIPPAIEAT